MPKIDAYEEKILSAYKEGKLKSVATKEELAKFKTIARATAIKDRRVNIACRPAILATPEGECPNEPHHHGDP